MHRVGAVVLAAGAGRRFGGAKLLAPFRERPLLSHCCQTIARAREQGLLVATWAVVAGGDEAARSLVAEAGLTSITNPDPDRGIAGSIRLGLEAATAALDIGAVLLLLGDQPLVEKETIERLIQAWRGGSGPVIRPRYADRPNTPGHPVLLDRSVWPIAHGATGDRGLAALLPSASLIDVGGANPDVDTAADLQRLEEPPR
jgi:CTP:molybdopterin cytidylyltransferase MocA